MKAIQYIFMMSLVLIGAKDLQGQAIHEHSQWNQLLTTYVNEQGDVDYYSLMKIQQKLEAYLSLLNDNPPQDSWTANQNKAYLINAYNAFTVKLIIDNYPLESIKDIGGVFSGPFSSTFAKIGDEEYSLDDIEKGMLLKMGHARVHFAVNCASESCPKLQNEAFIASELDQQLDAAAREFIHSDKNDLTPNKIELSKIFKWYASDFEKSKGSVIDFINHYYKQNINSEASMSYLSYSWKLNEK